MLPAQLLMEDVLDIVYRGRRIDIVKRQALPGRRTDLYTVVGRDPCVELGDIRWDGAWRQYAFFPGAATGWPPRCLEDIATFLRARTRQQRHPREGQALLSALEAALGGTP